MFEPIKILYLNQLSEKYCSSQYFKRREEEKTFKPKCFQIKK